MSNFGLSTRFSITFCYWDKGNFALTSNQGHFPFVKESAILRGCACYSYPYKMTAQFCSATLFRSGEFPPIHFRPGVAVLETPWHKPIEGEFPAFQFLADLPGLFSVRSLFVSRSSFTLVLCFTVALLKLWNAMLKFYCNPFELKLARQYWQTSLFSTRVIVSKKYWFTSIQDSVFFLSVRRTPKRALFSLFPFNVRFCKVFKLLFVSFWCCFGSPLCLLPPKWA